MTRRGGKRTGAGRPKGARNKATEEVRVIAQKHAPAAIEELARLSTGAESEAARVAASKELLDRAYGKAPQSLVADVDLRDARSAEHLTDAELEAIIRRGQASELNGRA